MAASVCLCHYKDNRKHHEYAMDRRSDTESYKVPLLAIYTGYWLGRDKGILNYEHVMGN